MKFCILVVILSLFFLPSTSYSLNVTPVEILAEKYSEDLFPEKFEYTKYIEKYKQAVKTKRKSIRKLDSLEALETLPMWPEEEQQKFKQIIGLAKNDTSGDVYTYIRELGSEYAFTLNKVLDLNELYVLERAIAKGNKEIKEAEEWAERVAKIVSYFYEKFIAGKLEEDIFYYGTILYVKEQILEVGKNTIMI